MEREEWLTRCTARYETRAGLHLKQARELAEIALDALFECAPEVLDQEQIPGFLDANGPEDEADGDMDCWDDDGEE